MLTRHDDRAAGRSAAPMTRRGMIGAVGAGAMAGFGVRFSSAATDIARVTWALPARIDKLDPAIADHIQTHAMSLALDHLMALNDDGSPGPHLAESVDQRDLTTCVYRLPGDVTFWIDRLRPA